MLVIGASLYNVKYSTVLIVKTQDVNNMSVKIAFRCTKIYNF